MRDPKSSQEITTLIGTELRRRYEQELARHKKQSTFQREIAKRAASENKAKIQRLTKEPEGFEQLKKLQNKGINGAVVLPRDISDVLTIRKKMKLEKDKILIEKLKAQTLDLVQMSNNILTSNEFQVIQKR